MVGTAEVGPGPGLIYKPAKMFSLSLECSCYVGGPENSEANRSRQSLPSAGFQHGGRDSLMKGLHRKSAQRPYPSLEESERL